MQDVDGPFGSAGSFFRHGALHGSFEANPPFVPAVLDAAAARVQALLAAAAASNQVTAGVQPLRASGCFVACAYVRRCPTLHIIP